MISLAPDARILIVLMGALGDVVRGLSLVHRLKVWSPKVRISWVVEPRCEEIVRAHPKIDSVFVFPRKSLRAGAWNFLKAVRREQFDVVLDLQRHGKSGIISACSGAPRRIGFHPENAKELNWVFHNEYIPWMSERESKLRHYHLFLDSLGVPRTELQFGLDQWSAAVPSEFTEVARDGVGVVLTSTWATKNWPEDRYRSLLHQVREQWALPIVLLGDRTAVDIASRLEHPGILNLVGKTSLQQLAGCIAKLKVLIGPDSGPGHLAGALRVPFVSIFGPTSPERVAFFRSEANVVRSPLGCAPCYRDRCPGLGGLCMRGVTPESVIEVIRRLLP